MLKRRSSRRTIGTGLFVVVLFSLALSPVGFARQEQITSTTQISLSPIKDAFVASGGGPYSASTNYGAESRLAVGVESYPAYSSQFVSFIAFDLSIIPLNATISKANLVLNIQGATSGPTIPVNFYKVGSGWTESSITWNNMPGSVGGPIATWTYPGTITSNQIAVDVTGTAQGWYVSPSTNYGLQLVASSSAGFVYFTSLEGASSIRPRLDVTYTVLQPDLVPTSVSVTPTTIAPGGSISVTFTVANQGQAASTLIANEIYLSTSQYSTAGRLLGNSNMSSIAAGSSKTNTASFTIPSDVSPGSYYVVVYADAGNANAEGTQGENNNINSTTITVGNSGDEANSSIDSATQLILGSESFGAFQSADDVDFFFVNVLTPGTLELRFKAQGMGLTDTFPSYRVAIYNPFKTQETVFTSISTYMVNTVRFNLCTPGAYFIELRQALSTGVEAYSILAELLPLNSSIFFLLDSTPAKSGANPIILVGGIGSKCENWLKKENQIMGELMRAGFSYAQNQIILFRYPDDPSLPGIEDATQDLGVVGQKLAAELARIAELSSGKKVDVVGFSQGGVVAREAIRLLSKQSPHPVGKLITLGSPHQGSYLLDPNDSLVASFCEGAQALRGILAAMLFQGKAKEQLTPHSDFLTQLNGPQAVDQSVEYFPFYGSIDVTLNVLQGDSVVSSKDKNWGDGVGTIDSTTIFPVADSGKIHLVKAANTPLLIEHADGPDCMYASDYLVSMRQVAAFHENLPKQLVVGQLISDVLSGWTPAGISGPVASQTVSWTPPASATQYHIQIAPANNDGPGINLIRNIEGSFTIQPPVMGQGDYVLLPDMTYAWHVRFTAAAQALAENSFEWGTWSEWHYFRTPKPSSNTISPVAPASDSAVSPQGATIQWSNSDTSVFYYEIQVSSDPQFNTNPATATSFVWWNLVHGGMTNPPNSWQTPPLEAGRTYYWRVRPRVQGDGTPVAWSRIWSFRTP